MTGEVYELPPHNNMTPSECLAKVLREYGDGLAEVMVIGYDGDGDLVVRTSGLTRRDGVWILLEALDHARSAT